MQPHYLLLLFEVGMGSRSQLRVLAWLCLVCLACLVWPKLHFLQKTFSKLEQAKDKKIQFISFPSIWMPEDLRMFLGVACLRGEDNANADVRLKAEGAALVPTWHLAVSRAETWLGKK